MVNFSKFFFYFFILSFSFLLNAQVDDPACQPPKKKVIKLLDKAKSENQQGEAVKLFRETIDKAPYNAKPYYEFARYAYKQALQAYKRSPNPKTGDHYLTMAAQYFKKSLERCPNYRADCFYYLGIINYNIGDKSKAIDYFQKFQNYKSPDVNNYGKEYQSRLQSVAKVLKKNKETQSFKSDKVPFDPHIVKNVSTPNHDEYFPMISPDNLIIFFTRKVNRAHKGDLVSDIREEFTWAKRKDMHSLFDKGVPLKPPFNDGTFESYGAASLSTDNKVMIICGCKVEEVQGQMYKNCDLYSTHYKRIGANGNDYEWSKLVNLGENINTKNGWEGQPSLSPDGNTLYFATNRPNTQNTDIYYSKRQKDGSWGVAQPFSQINTPGTDKSPFIHPDNQTFYFVSSVSKERKGLGGTDIFYMRKQADGSWGKPINIKYPINTKGNEIGLFVSIDGEKAFYSSRYRGDWNIYSFDLYKKARPQKVVIVKGQLTAKTDSSLDNVKIEVSYSNSNEVTTTRIHGNDGKYAVVVDADKGDAMVNIKKKGYSFDSKLIDQEELEQGKTITSKNMNVKKIKVGEPYTINDIRYQTASAELSKSDQFILRQFSRFLKENPTITLLIQGHTDDVGDDQNNLQLSEKRAQGVKKYLIQCGIKASRLAAKGYGETKPKVPNTSAKNRSINRRTDFVIQNK